jgi:N-acetylglucosamine-6-sulfatase
LALVRARLGLGLLALGLTIGLGLTGAAGQSAHAQKGPRPNVVLIITDDQRLEDMAALRMTKYLLGGGGVTFSRAYSSFPLCCPSRATILTGQYAHNHGVQSNILPRGGVRRFKARRALPVWLQRAGYRTIHVGKYLNGYGTEARADVPPGWSEWYGAVEPSAGLYYGYTLNENGVRIAHGLPGIQDPFEYQTDVYSGKAAAAIRRAAGRPFFLQLAFYAPHGEEIQGVNGPRPAPRHLKAYNNVPLPHEPAFNEGDISDKPPFLAHQLRKRLTVSQAEGIRNRYQRRQEALLSVDEVVSGIVSVLRETGVLGRTYIIFTTDNGFFQGEHRITAGKILPHEPASHVPLLIRGPGIPPGRVSNELVGNIDLTPTIVGIARGKARVALDGRSLLPFARRPGKRSRRPILLEGFAGRFTEVARVAGGRASRQASIDPDNLRARVAVRVKAPGYRAIRASNYLYVRYAIGQSELYDLKRDPNELRNVVTSPRYLGVRLALQRELHRFQGCRGRACRRPVRAIPQP